ncbi:MAG TPA: cupredoxin domain-containing protein [Thermomicrobiales bacterium]|jgi:plastocyanin|nr:cupredoxin domain-containing protein [Thermomicrobiales bacterium]
MMRFAVMLVIVVAAMATTIATGHDGFGAGAAPASTPAASPGACPTQTAATPAASPAPPPPALMTAGSVTIEMTDRGFDPAGFQSAVGQDVRVTLHNRGSRPHSFTIDRLHIDVLVPPGQTRVVTIPTPPLGEYQYLSRAPCDAAIGMTGTMVVFI